MGTLLAVFAHPDDETFICGGTLAKYAAEGHDVILVCATLGEMGRRMGVPPVATRETIGALRRQELIAACAMLAVSDLRLLHLRDKSLEIQPFDTLVASILTHMKDVQPAVVVTFHERLGGHPDHCTIGAAATAAFRDYRRSQPAAQLYFVGWPAMASRPDEYGLCADELIRVDVRSQLPAKLRAFRAHRTQSEMNAWLFKADSEGLRHLAADEYFIVGDIGGGPVPTGTLWPS